MKLNIIKTEDGSVTLRVDGEGDTIVSNKRPVITFAKSFEEFIREHNINMQFLGFVIKGEDIDKNKES